jgi:hypothetical protein
LGGGGGGSQYEPESNFIFMILKTRQQTCVKTNSAYIETDTLIKSFHSSKNNPSLETVPLTLDYHYVLKNCTKHARFVAPPTLFLRRLRKIPAADLHRP